MAGPKPDDPVLPFADVDAFSAWLAENARTAPVLWVRFYKKGTGIPTISKDDAVDEALCWGWIDGQLGKGDAESWLVRFTPRKPRSPWSKINRERVERMIAAGRMQPDGRAEVEAAKADGRWDAAYDKQSAMTVPADLVAAIEADPAALATYNRLNRQNLFSLSYRVNEAKKAETRRRRIAKFVAMLARGETPHPNGANK